MTPNRELEEQNLHTARQFLAAMEQTDIDRKLSFYAPDVVQVEYPNRITPAKVTRDLAALREGAERGAKVMAGERYEIVSALASGQQVTLEVQWTGTLAVAFGKLPAGSQLRASLAIFLEFREGKIVRQSNYDCYELW